MDTHSDKVTSKINTPTSNSFICLRGFGFFFLFSWSACRRILAVVRVQCKSPITPNPIPVPVLPKIRTQLQCLHPTPQFHLYIFLFYSIRTWGHQRAPQRRYGMSAISRRTVSVRWSIGWTNRGVGRVKNRNHGHFICGCPLSGFKCV